MRQTVDAGRARLTDGHACLKPYWGKPAVRNFITIVHTDGSRTGGMVNLNDGSVRDLAIRGHGFSYLTQGWLAFQQGTTVLAAAFDPLNPGRMASPVPVLENVSTMGGVARDGTLVYIPTRGESSARLVWVDREGRPTAVAGERLDYTHLDLAPDGRRALLNLESGQIDLIDLQGGTRKLLSPGGMPIWSSDGERATFRGTGGLQWMPADGSDQAQILVPREGLSRIIQCRLRVSTPQCKRIVPACREPRQRLRASAQ